MTDATLGGPGYIKATPELISGAATACDNTAGDVASQLGQLRTFVEGLQEYWKGFASISYVNLMDAWHRDALELQQALQDIASGLRGTAVNYENLEVDNTNNANQIASMLPGANL
jgi:WXG100 family type VII secretion target